MRFLVPAAWANTYAHRPIADVVAELSTFADRKALFIDLSPVEDVHYAKALYRAMIPLHMRWVGLATTHIAEDDELLKLAAQSGCRGLLIGFESISQTTLNESNKGFHASREYGEVVKKLHDYGIGIQGCFVFGFDNDDASVFERTVEWVDKVKMDLPRYAVVTPFPNTGLFHRLEAQGRLLHKNWALRCRTRGVSAQEDEPRATTGRARVGLGRVTAIAQSFAACSVLSVSRCCRFHSTWVTVITRITCLQRPGRSIAMRRTSRENAEPPCNVRSGGRKDLFDGGGLESPTFA